MTPEELCAALNHSWVCLNDGYYCPVCNRSFPLGIWAKAEEDKTPNRCASMVRARRHAEPD